MTEYEYLYCRRLHSKLKTRIIANIFCNIMDDKLKIRIVRGNRGFDFDVDDISNKICKGYSSDKIVEDCYTAYKKAIFSYYFY